MTLHRRQRFAFPAALALLAIVPLAKLSTVLLDGQSPSAAAIPIIELLERYEADDTKALPDLVQRMKNYEAFVPQLTEAANRWLEGSGASRERRRLVLATFVLDLAQTNVARHERFAFANIAHGRDDWPGNWRQLRNLIEWTCRLLRSAPQTAELELWYSASFEVVLRAEDMSFLFGFPTLAQERLKSDLPREYEQGLNHLGHGLDRFPRNQDFQLLRAEGSAERTPTRWIWEGVAEWVSSGTRVGPSQFKAIQAEARSIRNRPDRNWRHPTDMAILRRADFLTDLTTVRTRLEQLPVLPDVRSRVHLDLGLIASCLDDLEGALRHFAEVDSPAVSVNLRFLAHFVLGWVHAHRGNDIAAEAAYRSAHALRPDADSATVALSKILFTSGRRSEAQALVEKAVRSRVEFAGSLRPADPWLEFIEYGRLTSEAPLNRLRQTIGR